MVNKMTLAFPFYQSVSSLTGTSPILILFLGKDGRRASYLSLPWDASPRLPFSTA